MQKRLTERQFQEAVGSLDIGNQTKTIAFGVLVEGRPQNHYAKTLNISAGAVSQAVARVWKAHTEKVPEGGLPDGYVRVTAVLPAHRAWQVRKWENQAQAKVKRRLRTSQ